MKWLKFKKKSKTFDFGLLEKFSKEDEGEDIETGNLHIQEGILKCHVCGKTDGDQFDTHHINFQKDCKDGFVNDKPHLPMNSKANLVVLCKTCHHDVHHDKLKIKGYNDTSKGKRLRVSRKKKYSDEDINNIKKLADKKMSMREKKDYIKENWLDVTNMNLVVEWLDLAVGAVEGICCPGWVRYVDGYRQRADRHLTNFYLGYIGKALKIRTLHGKEGGGENQ